MIWISAPKDPKKEMLDTFLMLAFVVVVVFKTLSLWNSRF